MTQFRIIGTPVITLERIDIRFEFDAGMEDGTLLRSDHKTTPKWAWPRSRDQISTFWDPPITFERIELSISILVQTYRMDPPSVRIIKRPLSGRGPGHVT